MVRVVKKASERREEILATAQLLFLSKGYEQTTMQDIIEHLQIAKGTIYHYFKSKEELLEAVIDAIAQAQFGEVETVFQQVKGNSLERFQQLLLSTSHQKDHQDVIDLLHRPGNSELHIRLLAKMVTLQTPLYAELIRQGCEEGVFFCSTPLESAEFIFAAVIFLTDMGIFPWSEEQLQRRALAVPAFVERTLGASAGSFGFLLEILPGSNK